MANGEDPTRNGHKDRRDDGFWSRITKPEVMFPAIGLIFTAGAYYTHVSDGLANANTRLTAVEQARVDDAKRYEHIEKALVRIEGKLGLDDDGFAQNQIKRQ